MPPAHHTHKTWFALVAVIVIAIALISGIELARSNSDIVCSRSFQDSGSCTNGSWGPWTLSSQSTDQNACTASFNETRTYTGLRNTITAAVSIRGNIHALNYCNLGDGSFTGASGTVTSQFSACQIQESRTRVVTGTGSGTSCNVSATSYNPNVGTIISDNHSETDGEVDDSMTQTMSGTYQLYLDMIDARFATSSISVAPALLRSGETTRVAWTSDHVKTCSVVGTNGDSWPKPVAGTRVETDAEGNQTTVSTSEMPAGKTGSEVSQPIVQQTIYTLTCTTAVGTQQVSRATVNIIPIFLEQ